MVRHPRYRKNNLFSKVSVCVFLSAALIGGIINFFRKQDCWQDIIDNSVLQGKTLSLAVKELKTAKNDITAYLLEDNANPIVSIDFIFKNAGSISDDKGKQGLSRMVSLLLTEGAGDYDTETLKEELDLKAISITFSAGKDDFGGSLLTTKDNLAKAIYFLNLMLTSPRFDEDDILRIKQQMKEAILRQKEHPANELQLEFAEEVYGQHPYSENYLGRISDIEKLSKKDLSEFVSNSLSKRNLVVGIAGDVTPSEAKTVLEDVFDDLPSIGKVDFVRNAEIKFDGRTKSLQRTVGQNMLLAAMPSVGRNHDDFYPLFVANHIWGGSGLTSKLAKEIRERQGLTYSIYSYLSLDDKAPLMLVGFSATKENFAKAKKMLINEIVNFAKNGIDEQDLIKAKNSLVASYNLRFASIQNIAQILTAMQKYNLGLDFLQKRNEYIKQINLEQVNEVIRKYFNDKKIITIEIGEF